MINLAKLDEAIAYIEAHPEEHDQGTWFRRRTEGEWCQTTACLAGTVAVLAGWRPLFPESTTDPWGHVEYRASLIVKDGRKSSPWGVAEEVLGLTAVQSNALFIEAGNLHDIKAMRDEIAAGEW